MDKKRLVVIGNGMTGARLLEEVVARGGASEYEICVFGEEPDGNYNRILLSGVLAGSNRAEDIFVNPRSWYADNGIKLHAGVRAGWIDRAGKSVYAAGGISECYDKLVIATGSSAFVPPMAGMYDDEGQLRKGVFTFRTLNDCNNIVDYAANARRVAVIGGGLLGLEAAYGLLSRGLEVHIVHLATHLMDAQLDAGAGAVLKATLEDIGLHVHLGKLTTTVLGEDRITGLLFKDGASLDCDMVVIAAGIQPNTDLAKQSGLQVQRGIVVKDDLTCRNDSDVYAIGECAQHRGQLYGLVAPLFEQARVAADRITSPDSEATFRGFRASTKLKVMGVEVAVMGDKEARLDTDEVVHYNEPGRGVYKRLLIRDDRLVSGILLGDGLASAPVIQTFDRNGPVPYNRAELLFPLVGDAPSTNVGEMPDAAQICSCNGVSKGKIAAAVEEGSHTLKDVCKSTRAGTGCGACKDQVQAVIELAEVAGAAAD